MPWIMDLGQEDGQVIREPHKFLEVVEIPRSVFLMGSPDNDKDAFDDERPQRHVYLDWYMCLKFPVTKDQFYFFMKETGYMGQGDLFLNDWVKGPNSRPLRPPEDKGDHPVTFVSWYDAKAFSDAYGLFLLSEAQWEKAARGEDGRKYPWGDSPPDTEKPQCNHAGKFGGTTPVNMFDGTHEGAGDGRSPYGIYDMAGNVWEWCSNRWIADLLAIMKDDPETGCVMNPMEGVDIVNPPYIDPCSRFGRFTRWQGMTQDLDVPHSDQITATLTSPVVGGADPFNSTSNSSHMGGSPSQREPSGSLETGQGSGQSLANHQSSAEEQVRDPFLTPPQEVDPGDISTQPHSTTSAVRSETMDQTSQPTEMTPGEEEYEHDTPLTPAEEESTAQGTNWSDAPSVTGSGDATTGLPLSPSSGLEGEPPFQDTTRPDEVGEDTTAALPVTGNGSGQDFAARVSQQYEVVLEGPFSGLNLSTAGPTSTNPGTSGQLNEESSAIGVSPQEPGAEAVDRPFVPGEDSTDSPGGQSQMPLTARTSELTSTTEAVTALAVEEHNSPLDHSAVASVEAYQQDSPPRSTAGSSEMEASPTSPLQRPNVAANSGVDRFALEEEASQYNTRDFSGESPNLASSSGSTQLATDSQVGPDDPFFLNVEMTGQAVETSELVGDFDGSTETGGMSSSSLQHQDMEDEPYPLSSSPVFQEIDRREATRDSVSESASTEPSELEWVAAEHDPTCGENSTTDSHSEQSGPTTPLTGMSTDSAGEGLSTLRPSSTPVGSEDEVPFGSEPCTAATIRNDQTGSETGTTPTWPTPSRALEEEHDAPFDRRTSPGRSGHELTDAQASTPATVSAVTSQEPNRPFVSSSRPGQLYGQSTPRPEEGACTEVVEEVDEPPFAQSSEYEHTEPRSWSTSPSPGLDQPAEGQEPEHPFHQSPGSTTSERESHSGSAVSGEMSVQPPSGPGRMGGQDSEQVREHLYDALEIPREFLEGGEDYSGAAIAMEAASRPFPGADSTPTSSEEMEAESLEDSATSLAELTGELGREESGTPSPTAVDLREVRSPGHPFDLSARSTLAEALQVSLGNSGPPSETLDHRSIVSEDLEEEHNPFVQPGGGSESVGELTGPTSSLPIGGEYVEALETNPFDLSARSTLVTGRQERTGRSELPSETSAVSSGQRELEEVPDPFLSREGAGGGTSSIEPTTTDAALSSAFLERLFESEPSEAAQRAADSVAAMYAVS